MIRVETREERQRQDHRLRLDAHPMGSARHNEEFTRHDYLGPRSHPNRPLEYLFSNLPNIVKDEESVENADIVLWGTSSSHHEPRDEDGKPGLRAGGSGPATTPGKARPLVMWSGFDLRPRNFFDRTPLSLHTCHAARTGRPGSPPRG